VAYFDCFSGASGDMLLGALLDAGLRLEDLRKDLAALDLTGYELCIDRKVSHGITGTNLRVVDAAEVQPARHLSLVREIIAGSALPDDVKADSVRVFERLAQAEAAIHGVGVEDVHFHELGAVDTLVDIVGFCSAVHRLELEALYASPLPLGSGTIVTAHGLLPVPAPATLALLAEVGAPTRPSPGPGELVTPTGAAILSTLATFAQPPMCVTRVGYGLGTKEFPWANALRVWLGTTGGDAQVARAHESHAHDAHAHAEHDHPHEHHCDEHHHDACDREQTQ
jgi:uncharacterized protein (TIGR00299 family) protein